MKKIIVFFQFLLFGLFLVGCIDNQQENKNIKDNGIIEKRDDIEEVNNEASKSTRPPDLSLDGGNIHIPTHRYSYCWNKSNCSIEPGDPKEEVPNIKTFTVNSGSILTFTTSASGSYVGTPIPPEIIEVTQFHNGNESEIDVANNQLIAPEEEGVYFFNVHAIWEEEIQGEAYYALKMSVRNN